MKAGNVVELDEAFASAVSISKRRLAEAGCSSAKQERASSGEAG